MRNIFGNVFIPLLYVTALYGQCYIACNIPTASQSLLLCVLYPTACAKNCVIQGKTQVRARDRYTQKVNMFVILRRDILPSVFDLENCFRNLLNSRFSMQDAHTK